MNLSRLSAYYRKKKGFMMFGFGKKKVEEKEKIKKK